MSNIFTTFNPANHSLQEHRISACVTGAIRAFHDAGFRALIVGGAVRDAVMGIESKDIDIEVYGATKIEVAGVLERFGTPTFCNPGIFKVRLADGTEIDVILASRRGYNGEIIPDPTIRPMEALSYRDLTMNAMAYDMITNEWIDDFGGMDDIADRRLRLISSFKHARFHTEDPMRVMRIIQFVARFGFTVDFKTSQVCRKLIPALEREMIAKPERMWAEWYKLVTMGMYQSEAMQAMVQTGVVQMFPEIENLIGCIQDPRHHPEGDAFTHVGMVADEAARIIRRDPMSDDDKLIVMFSAWCHDMGKPETTEIQPGGNVTSYGHEAAGVPIAQTFLTRINCPQRIIDAVSTITMRHMQRIRVGNPTPNQAAKLMRNLQPATIQQWAWVVEADIRGRKVDPASIPSEMPGVAWIQAAERAQEAAQRAGNRDDTIPRFIRGEDVMAYGIPAGAKVGAIIKQSFDAYEAGAFEDRDGALVWLQATMVAQGEGT